MYGINTRNMCSRTQCTLKLKLKVDEALKHSKLRCAESSFARHLYVHCCMYRMMTPIVYTNARTHANNCPF